MARDPIGDVVGLRNGADCDPQRLADAWHARLREIALAVLGALYPAASAAALPRARRSAENAPPAL
jgi:hypothetical protein